MTVQQYPWHNPPRTYPKWCLEMPPDQRDSDAEYRLIHSMSHPPVRGISIMKVLVRLGRWLASKQ